MTPFSLEFFPPKDAAGASALHDTVARLTPLNPAFMTVTFGAGGSTRTGTKDTIADLQARVSIPIGAHLTFYGIPKSDVLAYADSLWDMGVRELVALRGDPPHSGDAPISPTDPDYFQKTGEFVTALKARHDFTVNVGAYPEKHPASPSRTADLAALREKMDAGADRAITQLFFDNTLYYRFLDEVTATGITAPIIPGIMPIHDFAKIQNFCMKCGASIPKELTEKFAEIGDNPAEHHKFAIDFLRQQIDDLTAHGVPHIHFYTLNRADIIAPALLP